MPFHEEDGLRYYTFESLKLKHAIFTRHGGVSPDPWKSLNFGSLVGDAPDKILENHRRAFRALDCNLDTKYDVWQVHSADVVIAEAPRPINIEHKKADAILTNRHNITLFMRFADCVPIFLYDDHHKVIGVVHAGWQGTIKKACQKAIETMQQVYNSNPAEILAAIGPSIGPNMYEVGDEVITQFEAVFQEDISAVVLRKAERNYLNLWVANQLLLRACGVSDIEVAQICTAESNFDWYSHRKENGKTGRFGALISLDY